MRQTINKVKKLAASHAYVFLLLALSFVFLHNIISSTKVMDNVHYINDVAFYSYNVKESMKRGELPLWTPYYYSGRPIFAQPEYHFIDLNFLLIFLTGNIYLSMNLSVILYLFIAGLGMHFLVFHLFQNKNSAVISALIYMFNGYVHTFVMSGNIMILEGYSLIPFIFLFTVKAIKEKEFIFNSIIAGIFLALQIFAGGVIFLPFIFLLIAAYCAVYAVHKNILNRILKIAIVGVLICAASFGLSAIKLLPGIEFMSLSNRGSGIPYQEFLGAPISLNNFAFTFITNTFLHADNISAAIGILGFVLLALSLYRLKDRVVLFSILIILLSLFMSSESFLTKILFNIPIINQTRHIERSIFLFAFAAPILAGLGFISLQSFLKGKKINENAAFWLVFFILFLELFLLQKMPQPINVVKPNEIPILDYMGNDKAAFRTMSLSLSTLIGASGYNYYSQYGIGEIKGGSGIWFNDYLNYLVVAQNEPAKFWGILNNKYVVANKNTSIEGLSYIGEFKGCNGCPLSEAWGPYLYKNLKYLPRYYVVPNSILVVGEPSPVNQLIYGLMLQNFEPKNTVIIQGTKINDYSPEFLEKFRAVVLTTGSVDQNSIRKLKDYASQGGTLIPDILSGQKSISGDDVKKLFDNFKGEYKEAQIADYSNNRAVIKLSGEKGWLVASERFSGFPGWKATIGANNAEIFNADAIISAVYLDGDKGELKFEYEPEPYKRGRMITMISVIAVLLYMGYFVFKKYKLKNSLEK